MKNKELWPIYLFFSWMLSCSLGILLGYNSHKEPKPSPPQIRTVIIRPKPERYVLEFLGGQKIMLEPLEAK